MDREVPNGPKFVPFYPCVYLVPSAPAYNQGEMQMQCAFQDGQSDGESTFAFNPDAEEFSPAESQGTPSISPPGSPAKLQVLTTFPNPSWPQQDGQIHIIISSSNSSTSSGLTVAAPRRGGHRKGIGVRGVAGAPDVSGQSDGAAIQASSTAADGRFQCSDASTGSVIPSNSNLQGWNPQQAMYNAPVPGYYFIGNNEVGRGMPHLFAAAPPQDMCQTPLLAPAAAPPPQNMYQTAPMAAAPPQNMYQIAPMAPAPLQNMYQTVPMAPAPLQNMYQTVPMAPAPLQSMYQTAPMAPAPHQNMYQTAPMAAAPPQNMHQIAPMMTAATIGSPASCNQFQNQSVCNGAPNSEIGPNNGFVQVDGPGLNPNCIISINDQSKCPAEN